MKAFFLLAAVLALPIPAAAQVPCLPWASALEQLADKWGEALMWQGSREGAGDFVVLANPAGTSWTMMLRRPDGQACALASGQTWAIPVATPPGQEG